MRAIAAFIMAGRLQAVTAIVGFAVLALAFPPAGMLSGAAVALVALRKGPVQVLLIVALSMAALAALSAVTMRQPLFGASVGAAQWLPPMVLALVLRRTLSWGATLQTVMLFGAGIVAAVHAMVEDPAARWRTILEQMFKPVIEQGEISPAEVDTVLTQVSGYMTGMFAAATVLGLVLTVILARYWQATLYNPGGFRTEFHALRVGRWPAVAVLGLLLAGTLGGMTAAMELAVVVLTVYLLQGIAVVHGIGGILGWGWGRPAVMYVLLVILPQVAALLAAMGVIDSFVDIRRRVAASRPGQG